MDTKSRQKRRSHLSALISAESKKRLKDHSERQDRSMSSLIEELIGILPDDGPLRLRTGAGKGEAWLKTHQGLFSGLVSAKDWERQDRFGDLLRKHVRP
ncbi:MAG: hypothetical protein JSS84_08805 [Bacteroidetes bacterium]|nr:hypothetical protein [Bacteroidota bacterium]